MVRSSGTAPHLRNLENNSNASFDSPGLREATYDGVPRTEFPVRFFVEHPAGGIQVASLRVAADERALGELVAREAALGGGGVELTVQTVCVCVLARP